MSESPGMLLRADSSEDLPRLGGMARADGVVIVSERFWAFARRDGTVREGRMPATPTALRRIPLLRGLVRLAAALSPLFRRTGVTRARERWLLAGALLAPLLLFAVPESLQLAVGVAVSLGLVAWLMRGRTLNLHGAEHRAIAAAEERCLLATWEGAARPSRISFRCGTNFAALALPVATVAGQLWPLPTFALTPVVVALVSLALTMELWEFVQGSQRRVVRSLLLPGLALQRLTTREPSLDETRLALTALASVLRRELT